MQVSHRDQFWDQHSSFSTLMTYRTSFNQTFSSFLMTTLSQSTHYNSQSESSHLLVEKRAESAEVLNNNLENIAEWGKKWLVVFNPAKTQTINISLKHNQVLPPHLMSGVQMESADTLHLLGIDISNKFSCTNHVTAIAKLASQCLGALYRVRSYLTKESIWYLYKR